MYLIVIIAAFFVGIQTAKTISSFEERKVERIEQKRSEDQKDRSLDGKK